jgi:beta-lactamase class A
MPKERGNKMVFMISLIALVGIGATMIGAGYFISQLNNRKSELAEYILANPESAAIAVYTFDEHGESVDDGRSLFYNADAPLVVASTMKIVVLAAYADAVVRGELDPNEQVSIADLESYYLPMTDGGAHVEGLASLGLAADASGFARDQTAKVSLDDIARIMIHNSGNAETDYLIARLGADKIAFIMSTAGLEHHTPIEPVLGVTLALLNHESP